MLYFFSFIIFILVMFSPLILLYGFITMKYELSNDRIIIKFLGLKFREILYKQIKSINKYEQFPFIKNQFWQNINKGIHIEMNNEIINKKYYIYHIFKSKKTIITPKNINQFFNDLQSKLQ